MYESESEVTQLCPTLCDPIDCSLPDSSVHGIFRARILEWVAISFCRASCQSRDQTCGSAELPGVLMGLSTFSSKCYADRGKISLAGECVGRMKEKAG